MNGEPTFVDTNVLVHAYDLDAGSEHDAARARLRTLWEDESGLMSTQVLQEFYVTVTRKLSRALPRKTAREIVTTYGAWPIHRLDTDDIIAASELEERHRLSFRDSLIIASARRSGARALLTEHLQVGRRFDDLVIVSPWVTKDLQPRVDLEDKDALWSVLDER